MLSASITFIIFTFAFNVQAAGLLTTKRKSDLCIKMGFVTGSMDNFFQWWFDCSLQIMEIYSLLIWICGVSLK